MCVQSAVFAALDYSSKVEARHLPAALAVWEYRQASASLFFDISPRRSIARRISQAVAAHPEGPTLAGEKRRQPQPIDQPLSPCHPDRSEAEWRDPRFAQV